MELDLNLTCGLELNQADPQNEAVSAEGLAGL